MISKIDSDLVSYFEVLKGHMPEVSNFISGISDLDTHEKSERIRKWLDNLENKSGFSKQICELLRRGDFSEMVPSEILLLMGMSDDWEMIYDTLAHANLAQKTLVVNAVLKHEQSMAILKAGLPNQIPGLDPDEAFDYEISSLLLNTIMPYELVPEEYVKPAHEHFLDLKALSVFKRIRNQTIFSCAENCMYSKKWDLLKELIDFQPDAFKFSENILPESEFDPQAEPDLSGDSQSLRLGLSRIYAAAQEAGRMDIVNALLALRIPEASAQINSRP